jgi:hypothetical protein
MSTFYASDVEMMVPVKGLSPPNKGILSTTIRKSTSSSSQKRYASLFSDLYNTDLSVDSRGAFIHEQDDIDAIIDLYHVDLEVDKSQNSVVRDIFYELHAIDITVDGKPVPSAKDITFVDSLLSSQMRHYQTRAMDQAQYNEDRADVMDLLATDTEIDQYSHLSIDTEIMHELAAVDKEMDSTKGADEAKAAFTAVKDLYDVDQEIDSHGGKRNSSRKASEPMEYSIPLKGLSPVRDPSGKSIEKTLVTNTYSSLMGDLYATDLSIDSRGATIHEKDDIAAILDLHSVDQAIDTKKTSAAGKIIHDIRKIDMAVDRIQEDNVEFFDPFLSTQMRQFQSSTTDQAKYDAARADVMDLWETDTEVDGRKYHSMDATLMNDLLSVDKEMDTAKAADEAKMAFTAVHSLYQVDKQVETFEPMAISNEQLGPPPPSNQKRSIFSPQEKAAAQKRSIFSEYEKAQAARRHIATPFKY